MNEIRIGLFGLGHRGFSWLRQIQRIESYRITAVGEMYLDWRPEGTDASSQEFANGHRGADYYVHTALRDAVLGVVPLEFEVYKVIDTAAPVIPAVDSISRGAAPMDVPDFRPNEERPAGQMPQSVPPD